MISMMPRWFALLLFVLTTGLTTMPARAQKAHDTAHLPTGFPEKSANVGGVRIHYKIGGQGPVVVLLHGYTQTSHMWTPLMPRLAASHTVIAPDLRGAGGSARTQDGYDKKTLANDIRGLVRQLGYERVQLVGHDIGLMVAYAYAAQYPDEVSKVVTVPRSDRREGIRHISHRAGQDGRDQRVRHRREELRPLADGGGHGSSCPRHRRVPQQVDTRHEPD